MPYNSHHHHRRTIRLTGYDYSQAGLYFVTICVQKHECLFGKIRNGEMILNEYGKIVQMVWDELPQHYKNVELGEFVVMPNHIHGIIIITDCADLAIGTGLSVGAGFKPAPTGTMVTETTTVKTIHGLSEIVRALKTFSARKINEMRNTCGEKLWQRNYYEHIIRNNKSYQYITDYIINNPAEWEKDKFYTE
jgi:REP element-mobilizing transposase RayT